MQNSYDLWMEKWNDRLKSARDKAGVKNTDIAKALRVSDPTVYGWMEGKTVNIEAQNLLPLCKILKVSPFWVLLGEKDESETTMLSEALQVSALEVVRLISLYAQSTSDGKRVILDAAQVAEKLPDGTV